MTDKCEDCGRKPALDFEEWSDCDNMLEFAVTCGARLGDYYLDEAGPDCQRATVARLRASLATALKVVVETDTLRRYFASRGVYLPALDRFDAARSELARLVQEKPLQQGDD